MVPKRHTKAVRGAAGVERNDEESILAATRELLGALIRSNAIDAENAISIFFTLTPDLNACFPARAARDLGLAEVPLMCAQEIPVVGAISGLVRVLIHLETQRSMRPVYLGKAKRLRPDLTLNPEEILVSLTELEREQRDGPRREITTERLLRRVHGRGLGEPISPEERAVFTTAVRELQTAGRAGCILTAAGHDWFLLP